MIKKLESHTCTISEVAKAINEVIDLLAKKFPEEFELELKPCPFCGSTPMVDVTSGSVDTLYEVFCDNPRCNADVRVTSYTSEELAIERWNRRANV